MQVKYSFILLAVRSSRKHQNSYSYSEYLTFAVGSNVLMYCMYTYSTRVHKGEGGMDQVMLQYLRAFEFDDLLPPFFDPNRMIIDCRLKIFKVEGKRYIICSNHEILFILFRPLFLYLKGSAR